MSGQPFTQDDIKHAERITRERSSKPRKLKTKPNDYVKKIGELEDGQEIIASLRARAEAAADFRFPFEAEWRDAYLAWHQVLQEKNKEDKWRSKRFIPMIFQHIETSHPALVAAVFSSKKIWKLMAHKPDSRDSADALDHLLHWAAEGPCRMRGAYAKALWWSLCIGTGYIDHQWNYETEMRRVMVIEEDEDEDGNPLDHEGRIIQEDDPDLDPEVRDKNVRKVKVEKEDLVTVNDQPLMKSINPFYVWSCPNSELGSEGEWYFIRHDTTLDKLVEAADEEDSHLDAEAVAAYIDSTESWDLEQFREFEGAENLTFDIYDQLLEEVGYRFRRDGTHEPDPASSSQPIYLLIYRSKTETITIAPGWKILGYSENPYIHGKTGIVVHQHYPIDGCPYGRGLGGILLPHQDLVNENINRAMDVAEVTAMAPIGVDRSRVSVLDDNFRWKPNSIIRTRGSPREAIARLDMPSETNLAMQWDQHIKRDADETTGVAEQARGGAQTGVNTATEFSGLQANIKTRSFMHVERLKDTVAQSGQLLVQMFQQFMTKDQVVLLTGESGMYYQEVSHLNILGAIDIRVDMSPTALAPAMRVQQMISLTQVIVPLMQQGQSNPFFMHWIRMMLEEIDIPDVDRFIPKNLNAVRDPLSENIALRSGVKVPVSLYDMHAQHIQHHSELLKELQEQVEAGEEPDGDIEKVMEHLQEHFAKASQSGGGQDPQAGGGGGTADNGQPEAQQGGNDPNRQEATALGAAQGNQGTGAASPGPAAAPGRAG